MEFNLKYEIIENYPSILKTRIPLFDFFIGITYYIGSIIFLIYKKRPKNIFSLLKKRKTESIKGQEITNSVLFNVNKIEFKRDNEEDIYKTDIIFFYKEDSKKILNSLIKEGFKIDPDYIKKDFIIKEIREYSKIRKEKQVYFSSSEFANKLAKFLKFKRN